MEKNIFGKRLREVREQEGMTQLELAKALKVEQSHISKWERGERIPETKTVVSIALFFRTSADFLLGISNNQIT